MIFFQCFFCLVACPKYDAVICQNCQNSFLLNGIGTFPEQADDVFC